MTAIPGGAETETGPPASARGVAVSGASAAVTPPPDTRLARSSPWKSALKRPEIGSLGGLVLIFAFFFVLAPPVRHLPAITTILYESATLGIPSVAVALLMIGGEFDLSAGVAVTTSSLTAAITATELVGNVWVGVGLALLMSLGIGFLNGYLLVRTKLHSFLVTLSTFLMLQGLNIAVTKLITGNVATGDISGNPGFASAQAVFAASIPIGHLSISILVFYWLAFALAGTWVLLRTRVGNWIFAVGGQVDSARAVGIPVRRVKIGLFMLVGLAAWFTGMHLLFAFVTVQSGAGIGNELLYIASAVVGGCLLTGGYGSAAGSALGALIFGLTTEGVIYADWDPNWFQYFVGAMLLLATVFNGWLRLRVSTGK